MGDPWQRRTLDWLYEEIFEPEPIRPRQPEPGRSLPPLLLAARSLEKGNVTGWQSRTELFVKQARLLKDYEDDCPSRESPRCYFPTYQSLTDEQLRGYFTWRARLRRGQPEKAALAYPMLYIYELLNLVGVSSPEEAREKLMAFRECYCPLDPRVELYLQRWIRDFSVYYALDPAGLSQWEELRRDRALGVLADVENRQAPEVAEAVEELVGPKALRSRFFRGHREEMARALLRTLQGVSRHYARGCRITMTEQYFGLYRGYPARLLETAVFAGERHLPDREYWLSPVRVCRCRSGEWTEYCYAKSRERSRELEALIRNLDARMRAAWEYPHPLKEGPMTKWLGKVLDQAVEETLEEARAAEKKKPKLDLSGLKRIRADAEYTCRRLAVEEELWEPEPEASEPKAPAPPEPVPEDPDCPLDTDGLRLLRCLLFGGDLQWLRREGKLRSVLTDRINEALYDRFGDTVLSQDGEPLEDYIDELKEMVQS